MNMVIYQVLISNGTRVSERYTVKLKYLQN